MANKPNGNLTGIKSAMLDRLKSLYDFKQGLDEFASFELLSELCACSGEINREISVYISRDGSIVDVSVGDSAKVSMPSMRLVRNEDRLCGVRCIHTHPSGDGRLSGVDLGTLRSMKLDCMAAVGVSDGKPTQLYAAYLGDFDEDTGSRAALVYGPMRPYKLPQKALIAEIFNSDDRFRSTTKEVEAVEQERAHGGRHADADGRHIAFDVLHGVIDGHSGGDAAARAVDIELDVLVRILGFQIQKLCHNETCRRIVDFFGQEHNTVVQQTGKNVVAALTAAGLLHNIGY